MQQRCSAQKSLNEPLCRTAQQLNNLQSLRVQLTQKAHDPAEEGVEVAAVGRHDGLLLGSLRLHKEAGHLPDQNLGRTENKARRRRTRQKHPEFKIRRSGGFHVAARHPGSNTPTRSLSVQWELVNLGVSCFPSFLFPSSFHKHNTAAYSEGSLTKVTSQKSLEGCWLDFYFYLPLERGWILHLKTFILPTVGDLQSMAVGAVHPVRTNLR